MAKNKKIKRDKRLKKMKKERGWLSTLIYFALVAVTVFLFITTGLAVVNQFFVSEIHEEDEDLKFCASVYDNVDEEQGIELLKLKGREFFIYDPSVKVLYEN